MKRTLSFLVAVAAISVTACGGGGSDTVYPSKKSTSPSSSASTGVLSDSAVAGVAYLASPSGRSGTTNANGEFSYLPGDTVTFTLAGHSLPPVPATGRITPATLAAELIAANVVSGDAADVALNLAILFQALDDDGNPDNGINVRTDVPLSTFLTDNAALSQSPATFAANLEADAPALTVPDPVAAAEHYYRNELLGNWRLDRIEHEEAGTISPTTTFDILIAFDASGRSLWVEYDAPGTPATCSPFAVGYSAIYTGIATFDPMTAGLVTMESNARDLLTGCASGSTDHVADMFEGTITIEGAQLVISHPTVTNRKVYFNRFDNQKNSEVGFWAEQGGTVTRNTDGTLEFGDDINGLFSFFTGTRWVHVVLDRLPGGENCEYNGVYVAGYNINGDSVFFESPILNNVFDDPQSCGKTLPLQMDFADSRKNDTVRPILFENIEDGALERNLALGEALSLFRQYEATPLQDVLTGSWLIDASTDPGSRFAILTLLADGRYVLGVDHIDSECGDGLEFGHYTLSADNPTLSVTDVQVDTTGPQGLCGLFEDGLGAELDLQIDSANRFSIPADVGRMVLNRIENDGVRGTWFVNDASGLTMLSFLPDNRHMAVQIIDTDEAPDSLVGLETGRYTLSDTNVLGISSITVDTNGTSGLSDLRSSGDTLQLNVVNDQLSGDGFSAVRTEDMPPPALP